MTQVPGDDRQLDWSRDLSTWPNLKLARARQLAWDLHARIDLAVASTAKLVPAYSADRRVVVFCMPAVSEATLSEWALLAGDVVHNYRSALDAFAWELAHLDGAEPAEQVKPRIVFPICLTEQKWVSALKGYMRTLPPFIRSRLGSVQPYRFERPSEGIFAILHRLDILDKHRGALRVEQTYHDTSMFSYRAVMQDGREAGSPEWDVDFEEVGPLPGPPLFSLRFEHPLEYAESTHVPPLRLQIVDGDTPRSLFEMFDLIDFQIEGTWHVVMTGSSLTADTLRERGIPDEVIDKWFVEGAPYDLTKAH